MSLGRLKRLPLLFLLVLLSSWTFPPQTRAGFEHPAAASWTQTEGERPFFENRLETEHFILKWTVKSPHRRDNIRDPEIVRETAGYLETAWEKLTGLFGRTPYLPPGSHKIAVVFKDLEYFAYADPPEGPIELNSFVWQKMPSIRQATSAHELFHKLQCQNSDCRQGRWDCGTWPETEGSRPVFAPHGSGWGRNGPGEERPPHCSDPQGWSSGVPGNRNGKLPEWGLSFDIGCGHERFLQRVALRRLSSGSKSRDYARRSSAIDARAGPPPMSGEMLISSAVNPTRSTS